MRRDDGDPQRVPGRAEVIHVFYASRLRQKKGAKAFILNFQQHCIAVAALHTPAQPSPLAYGIT